MFQPTVQEVIKRVYNGQIVLPEFQRSFVWSADDIKELLVSVLADYHIGTLLYMDVVREESIFALRLVEGVADVNPHVADEQRYVTVLLDGQQRTTSLFYAMYSPDLPLPGKKGYHRFFINIPRLLAEDYDDAVSYAITTTRAAMERLVESPDEIPVSEMLDPVQVMQRVQSGPHREHALPILQAVNSFLQRSFNPYELPRDTPPHRVVETFERINRLGRALSVEDLLVAKLWKSKLNLRDLIQAAPTQYRFLGASGVDTQYILRLLALVQLGNYRRKNLLKLGESGDFERHYTSACDALEQAFTRITDCKSGYGVFDFDRWVPFKVMLLALGALHLVIARDELGSASAFAKLDEWYWSTAFGNRYNEAVNTTIEKDFKEMVAWLRADDAVPSFISNLSVSSVELEVSGRADARYRAVMGLIVLQGARDFDSGQAPEFRPNRIQDDHIFPVSRFSDNRVLVRTLIADSNQRKSNRKPSDFFTELGATHPPELLERILASHFIGPAGLQALLSDDLAGFVAHRKELLQAEIRRRLPRSRP